MAGGGGDAVRVVGRADRHGVDVLPHLVEHLAEVVVLLRVFEADRRLVQALVVDVADGDHLAVVPGVAGVAGPLAADADAGEANFFQGTPAFARGDAAGDPKPGPHGSRRLHKLAARLSAAHVSLLEKCEPSLGLAATGKGPAAGGIVSKMPAAIPCDRRKLLFRAYPGYLRWERNSNGYRLGVGSLKRPRASTSKNRRRLRLPTP